MTLTIITVAIILTAGILLTVVDRRKEASTHWNSANRIQKIGLNPEAATKPIPIPVKHHQTTTSYSWTEER